GIIRLFIRSDSVNILELQHNFDEIITDAEKDKQGDAVVRTLTIYKDVIMYLITHDKLTMSDRDQKFWDYTKQYTMSALYRVAEYYHKENNMPPLNYRQPTYHNKGNTLEEWRGLQLLSLRLRGRQSHKVDHVPSEWEKVSECTTRRKVKRISKW